MTESFCLTTLNLTELQSYLIKNLYFIYPRNSKKIFWKWKIKNKVLDVCMIDLKTVST